MVARSRLVRGVLAAVVLGTTAAGGAASVTSAAGPQACNSSPTYAGGGWLAFKPQGLGPVTTQTSVTYAPDRIYATDGTTVSRTDDGGCLWQNLALPATPLVDQSPLPVPLPVAAPSGSPHVQAISAPSTSTSARFVYLAADLTVPQADLNGLPPPVNGTRDPTTQPYVYVSSNGGLTFFAYHSGFPTLGAVTDIAASPTGPNIVYATVTDSAGDQSGLYRSIDFGQTWTRMSASQPVAGTLKVNPAVSTSVFATFADGTEVSTDAGATFSAVSHTAGTAHFDVAAGAGYIQLVQGYSDRNLFERSTTGGNTFVSHLSPVKASVVATSALADAVLLGGDSTDWMEVAQGSRYVALPVTPSAGPLSQVSMGAPVGGALSASGIITPNQTSERLVARLLVGVVGKPRRILQLTPVTLLPHGGVRQFPSTMFPFTSAVRLGPGQHQDITYQLLLPRTPTPVDLMFLVDTTSSTDDTLNGVRQSLGKIADQLAAIGLDVKFGVAEFRDYPPDDYGNGEPSDYPYKLRRKVGPYNQSLAFAIDQLHSGGGGDLDEAALTALYQSTLGSGQTIVDVNNRSRQLIAPGGDAGYRPNSLRLAVVASDAAYHKEPDYPTPSWSSTVAALQAHNVHQIGLAVQTMSAGVPTGFDSLRDMRRMATSTAATAPVGGVDCNGDGTVDVAQGEPLVCKIPHPPVQKSAAGDVLPSPPPPPLPLANPIADLAANIPDLSTVGLRVTGAPATAVSVVSVPSAPLVNLHADNTVNFTVRYICPIATKAQSWNVSLDAVAGLRALTSSASSLDCAGVPKPSVIPPAAIVLPGLTTVAVAPAPPPNPPAQSSGNANPNPALNANAGFAQQQDEERQLAFADADQGVELAPDDQSMAMSKRPSRDDTAFLAGAAGLLMTGFAVSYARRQRYRTQCSRVGTWRSGG